MACFKFNRRFYEWRRSGAGVWLLASGSRVVARVSPDALYRGMCRVDLGDGRTLSDRLNLARAKDAALSRADRALDNGRVRPGGALLVRSDEGGAQPPLAKDLKAQVRPWRAIPTVGADDQVTRATPSRDQTDTAG
jgi:hypothetical protein